MYDLGMPQAWRDQPVGRDRGMALEESQSLLLEMIIGRSRPFVTWLQPLLVKHFGVQGPEWEVDALLQRLTRVRRGLIRVDADELSYPLHILHRYEIEKNLVAGQLQVADLPEVWNTGMERRFGARPANVSEGCLQDVHWALGLFGYFPSYVLGSVIAAQLWESLRAQVGRRRRADRARRVRWRIRLAARPRARLRRQAAGQGPGARGHRPAAGRERAAALPRSQVRGRARHERTAGPRCRPRSGASAARLRGLVGKAIEDYRDDRGRRPRDGLPVGRQGFLHAAGHAAVAPAQRAGGLRADRGEPRPEAAGISGARAARLPALAGRALPHHRAGHLQRREAADPRGPHDVLAVFAHAPRRAVPLCRRERHHQGGAGSSSRRHRRDAVPEPVPRRPAQGHGAEAASPRMAGTS